MRGDVGRVVVHACDAVDRLWIDPAVADRVPGCIEMECELRHVRDDAELGRLGGTDDRSLSCRAHDCTSGVKTGTLMSPRLWKATMSSMSKTSPSGVLGTPTM